MARAISAVAAISTAFALCGCGTTVPVLTNSFSDPPDNVTDNYVQHVVEAIHCELETAVTSVIDNEKKNLEIRKKGAELQGARFYNTGFPVDTFEKNWGAEVTLTLQVEDKFVVSPTGTYLPPSPANAIFTLTGALSATSDATRVEKISFYYTISELYKNSMYLCKRPVPSEGDSLLVQSDLKLHEWLNSYASAINNLQIGTFGNQNGPFKQNVISHEVKFDAITTGSLTPALKLSQATFDQTGSLFTGTKDHLNDLAITIGPLDPSQKASFLVPGAEALHLATQLSPSSLPATRFPR